MILTKSLVLRLIRTINVDLACAGMGLVMSTTGVAMLDLADIYRTDVKHVSWLVTVRGVGLLLGSLLGGRLYDRYNTQVLSIAMMVLQAASIVALPLCGELEIAYAPAFVSGVGLGALDTGAHVWLMNLWPANCGPALQVYHFAFGMGAFVGPLITNPFLSGKATPDADPEDFLQVTPSPSAVANNGTTIIHQPSQIQYPFAIVAGVHVFLAIAMIVAYLVDRSDSKPPPAGKHGQASSCHCFSAVFLCLLGAYIMTVIGLECSYGQMLATFAVVSDVHFTKSSATYITSVFYLTFSVARIASAFWAAVSSPLCMLVSSQAVLLVAHGVLALLGNTSSAALWSATAFSGVAQAALYGTAVSWGARHLVFTNSMMSVLTVAAALGEMSPPVLVGQFVEGFPMVLMYVCFGAALFMSALLVSMYALTRNRKELRPGEDKQAGEVPAQSERL